MAQVLKQKQRQFQSPQQYLISTMVQSTTDELEQLINEELEKNVALEVVDPSESAADDTDATTDDTDGYSDTDSPTSDRATEDGALSDDERGDKIEMDHDDDMPTDTSSQGSGGADDSAFSPIDIAASEQTFRDDLKQQINMLTLSAEERFLAHYLIDCLDDDGYLHRPLYELVDDLEFNQRFTTTEEDLEAVLVEVVQEELEPSGIGARDLRECLLLQIRELKSSPATQAAYMIVDHCFDDLSNHRYDRIQQLLGITDHRLLVDALSVIRHRNAKPGNLQPATPRSSELRSQQVRPDFIVRNEEGHLTVTLCDERVPLVRISADQEDYLSRLEQEVEQKSQEEQGTEGSEANAASSAVLRERRDGVRFLREQIQNGRNFIDALSQRRITLLEVMQTIVSMQRGYFITGQIETLTPMTLQDVADRCDYDISTISRVSNSKYVDTEHGIILIKDLFTSAVADTNQTALQETLRQIIEAEDKSHPYTDEALVAALAQQGYHIARRTVVKYREALGIPVARLRKELK